MALQNSPPFVQMADYRKRLAGSSTCGLNRAVLILSNHVCSSLAFLWEDSSGIGLRPEDVRRMPAKNFMSCNILSNGYTNTGDRMVFDKMDDWNVPSWNAMIAGYTQFEYSEDALALFAEMCMLGFSPAEFTFGSMLRGYAGSKD
ncbi:hypothetical protein MLD38_009205 [Melastoma candidum]|uniref:Uncharacterized protein n=1 Tax=Melastoma candidum TaxID=119954 RepID=A0ACB9RY34_9MYRT|nr:hypothetical protein MLD38_009205 [Melastoma candidum]